MVEAVSPPAIALGDPPKFPTPAGSHWEEVSPKRWRLVRLSAHWRETIRSVIASQVAGSWQQLVEVCDGRPYPRLGRSLVQPSRRYATPPGLR